MFSEKNPYQLLIDRASVVVVFTHFFSKARIEVFDSASITGFCPEGKIPMIVFLNEDLSVCFELGFGRTNPYSIKSPWRALKHRPPIEITPVMWKIIGGVVNQVAIRKTSVSPPYRPYGSKRAGRRFWTSGKKLIVYDYCGHLFQRGIKLTLGKQDINLVNQFLDKEPHGRYWRKRIKWVVWRINSLMRGTTTMRGKGLNSLGSIFSYSMNKPFLRASILKEIMPRIGQKERFLRFLWERKFMTLEDYVSYSNPDPSNPDPGLEYETNVLNFVLRGERKNGNLSFEVFPEKLGGLEVVTGVI